MRCDQFMGLTDEARVFLRESERIIACDLCHRPFPSSLEVIGHYTGMFEDVYDLYGHRLKGGGLAVEYLQASPWSSGPCFFIGLKVLNKNLTVVRVFEWSAEEINNC